MKKFAIISVSAVLLIAVICVAAFAFWDTTNVDVEFSGNSIGSSITLTTTNVEPTGATGYGKKLVSQDAIVGTDDAKLVCVGGVKISITSEYKPAEWSLLIQSLKYTISDFKVADVAAITKSNYTDTFELYLNTAKDGTGTTYAVGSEMFKDVLKDKTDATLYLFLAYKKGLDIDGSQMAKKDITIKVQFTIA